MSLRRTFKVAWEGLTLNKARSFLTTLGVIIGVAAVIVMLAVSAGAEAEIADQINSLGANLIMIMPSFTRGGFGEGGPPPGLSYDDIDLLAASLTGINGASAEESTTEDVKAGKTTLEDISVVGTTSGFPDVRDYEVALGRFLSDEDNDRANKVAVLGYDIAGELFGDPDSALGQKIKIGSAQFTVVGVMAGKGVVGNTDYDGRVYIPITTLFAKFRDQRFGGDTVRLVYVSAESKETMDSVMAQLPDVLYGCSTPTQPRRVHVGDAGQHHRRPSIHDGVLSQSAGLGGCHLAGGRRYRDYEHHVGQRHRADPRDWPAAGAGRTSPRRAPPVSAGSHRAQLGGWAAGRTGRCGWVVPL